MLEEMKENEWGGAKVLSKAMASVQEMDRLKDDQWDFQLAALMVLSKEL